MDVLRILGNSALMLTLSFITALATGGFPSGIALTNSNIAMITLVIMMSISLTNLRLRGLRVRDHAVPVRRAFLLSMVLASGATVLIAFLYEGDLRAGWIIAAAVPSAISVVPFTYLMKGDLEPTLVSTAALYLIALAYTPLLALVFLGQAIDVTLLLTYVGLLIILPICASRPLRRLNIPSNCKSAAVNVTFFVLIVAVAGPNRQIFFQDFALLSGLLAAAVLKIFGIGLLWNWYLKRKNVPHGRRVPEVLFSSHKNTGMAATLAIALIGPAAAVPATVCATVDIAWMIFLSHVVFRNKDAPGAD
jgi:BASS family bile acid:Na+ symporter